MKYGKISIPPKRQKPTSESSSGTEVRGNDSAAMMVGFFGNAREETGLERTDRSSIDGEKQLRKAKRGERGGDIKLLIFLCGGKRAKF